MSMEKNINKGVSAIPLIISIMTLFLGGFLGTWFVVEENVYYFAYDSSYGFLDGESSYVHYLEELSASGPTGDSDMSYDERNCNCENRYDVFFNIKLLIYLTAFTSLVGTGILFARDVQAVKQLPLSHPVKKLISPIGRFSAHVSSIVLILFLAGYIVFGIPGAIEADYEGTMNECLYDSSMSIVGNSDCFVDTVNDQAELHSSWSLGVAPFIFIVGVLIPSIFSASSSFEEINADPSMSVPLDTAEPEYFFDPEAQILFDVNTGEVVASFIDEERDFFYYEEAMVLFDEESGDILFSPSIEKK